MILRTNRYLTAAKKQLTVLKSNRTLFQEREPKNNLHLFGFGRGGSTWLAEIITSMLHEGPFIDEPFHRAKINFRGKKGSEFLGWKEYIEPGESNEVLSDYYESINSLTHLDRHLISEFNCGKPFNHRGPIVLKYIDRTYLIPFLIAEYQIKPIYLTRQPYACFASRKRYGWPTGSKIAVDRAQSKTSLNHLRQIQRRHPDTYSASKVFAIHFCEHIKTFRSISASKLEVSYEKLMLEPESVLKEIFGFSNVRPKGIANLTKPSASSRGLAAGTDQLHKWKEQLSSAEILDISQTLEEYNLEEFLL